MNLTRKTQLQWLVGLSAASAAIQYVVQGVLASEHDLNTFPGWFWVLDYAFWAGRALIESAVIVYLFQTRTDDATERRVLASFEVALVALITLTVGPALRALDLGQTIRASLHPLAFWARNFGIAAYTSLMMGATGYAYKVQPEDEQAEPNAELLQQLDEAQATAAAAQQAIAAVEEWQLLDATARARWIAQNCNGDRPAQAALARAMGVSSSTISRAYRTVDSVKEGGQ